jgi:hypothetical protein
VRKSVPQISKERVLQTERRETMLVEFRNSKRPKCLEEEARKIEMW